MFTGKFSGLLVFLLVLAAAAGGALAFGLGLVAVLHLSRALPATVSRVDRGGECDQGQQGDELLHISDVCICCVVMTAGQGPHVAACPNRVAPNVDHSAQFASAAFQG